LSDGFAGLCRTKEYLKYKTYGPSAVLGIAGAQIWMSTKPGMAIGDMDGVNEMNFIKVIGELKRLAKILGLRQIQFHCCPGTQLHRLFSAHFTGSVSYPMFFQDFGSEAPPEKIKFTFADIDIF
jgi:hypothetical protein